MTPTERAHRVRLERKAFRAARPPKMPAFDRAGVSTKPWGSRGIRGIGLSAPDGPSKIALDFWKRQTRGPASTRRRKRGPFALSTPTL